MEVDIVTCLINLLIMQFFSDNLCHFFQIVPAYAILWLLVFAAFLCEKIENWMH